MTTDPLDAVADAYERKIRARDALDEASLAAEQVLTAWWPTSGVPKTRAGGVVQQRLRERGWTQEQIDRAGVADGTVRAVLDRPRG